MSTDLIKSTFDVETISLIKEQIAKGANDQELKFFLMQCARTKLDPFARQMFCVPRWDQELGKKSYTPQISIDGMRLVAERTGKYRGQAPAQWCGPDGIWVDVWLKSHEPSAARVFVHREGFHEPCPGLATWKEFAQRKKDGSLTAMWSKFPSLMLAKCAEALALRRAFPQELSGLYTPDEMGEDAPIEAEVVRHPVQQKAAALPEPPIGTYQESNGQKKILRSFALEHGITEKAQLQALSAAMMGVDLEDLRAKVAEWCTAQKPKPPPVAAVDPVVLKRKQQVLADLERQYVEWEASDDERKQSEMQILRNRQEQVRKMDDADFLKMYGENDAR